MGRSIKFKFILGLSIILLLSGITLNILIRQVFETKLENSIKNSMRDIMNNSREYIGYKLLMNNLPIDEEGLKIISYDILYYFTSTHNCNSQIRNIRGEIIESNIGYSTRGATEKVTKAALDGKAIVNLQYSDDNEIYSTFAYPLYYEEKFIGIINISRNYGDLYRENKKIIDMITFVETGIFIIIFILAFVFTSKIVKPIIILTKEVKRIGEGDYEAFLDIKGHDEIAILSKEFMDMKDKIKGQIDTINREKEKVQRLEEGRREFFNNVTHELKTPLTAISGYSQMLLDKNVKNSEFRKRAIKRIYMESERMHRLVLDLISVSRDMSVLEEETQAIDMQRILKEICDDMNIKAQKYHLELYTDIQEGFILGKINKIRQLIINIIDNAIKYSFSGEKILVKAFKREDYFITEVINRGEKIPKEVYLNIFAPFVKGLKESEEYSSGLGLYICNEIVKQHNGQIEIENGEVIKVKIKIPSLRNNLETTEARMEKSKCYY